MINTQLDAFQVIGISVRTTNENAKAAQDIPKLWEQFLNENILEQIPNRINDTIYSIYTDYEDDYTKPYTTILACAVSTLETIPDGMIGKRFDASNYMKFEEKGNLHEGLIYKAWENIWCLDLKRTYKADFEMYGEKAQNPINAEVDIYVSIQ